MVIGVPSEEKTRPPGVYTEGDAKVADDLLKKAQASGWVVMGGQVVPATVALRELFGISDEYLRSIEDGMRGKTPPEPHEIDTNIEVHPAPGHEIPDLWPNKGLGYGGRRSPGAGGFHGRPDDPWAPGPGSYGGTVVDPLPPEDPDHGAIIDRIPPVDPLAGTCIDPRPKEEIWVERYPLIPDDYFERERRREERMTPEDKAISEAYEKAHPPVYAKMFDEAMGKTDAKEGPKPGSALARMQAMLRDSENEPTAALDDYRPEY